MDGRRNELLAEARVGWAGSHGALAGGGGVYGFGFGSRFLGVGRVPILAFTPWAVSMLKGLGVWMWTQPAWV